jgi:hypothetical protein
MFRDYREKQQPVDEQRARWLRRAASRRTDRRASAVQSSPCSMQSEVNDRRAGRCVVDAAIGTMDQKRWSISEVAAILACKAMMLGIMVVKLGNVTSRWSS